MNHRRTAEQSRTWMVIIVGLAAAIPGCSNEGGGGTIAGDLLVHESFSSSFNILEGADAAVGEPCLALSYSASTNITVRDSEGMIVATGHPASDEGSIVDGDQTGLDCSLSFVISNVPESEFYTVSVDGIEGETTVPGDATSGVALVVP